MSMLADTSPHSASLQLHSSSTNTVATSCHIPVHNISLSYYAPPQPATSLDPFPPPLSPSLLLSTGTRCVWDEGSAGTVSEAKYIKTHRDGDNQCPVSLRKLDSPRTSPQFLRLPLLHLSIVSDAIRLPVVHDVNENHCQCEGKWLKWPEYDKCTGFWLGAAVAESDGQLKSFHSP